MRARNAPHHELAQRQVAPQQKAIVVAHAVLNLAESRADEWAIRSLLVDDSGLSRLRLKCVLYLSDDDTATALAFSPDYWSGLERSKADILQAISLSAKALDTLQSTCEGSASSSQLAQVLQQVRLSLKTVQG